MKGMEIPRIRKSISHAFQITILILTGILLPVGAVLFSADLWRDHNPYSVSVRVKAGTILKLQIDEPMRVSYEYERVGDEKTVLKLTPDKKTTKFLSKVNSDMSISGRNKITIKSLGRIRMKTAVRVQRIDEAGNIIFEGSKRLAYENGRAVQTVRVTGAIHVRDIDESGTIHSGDVADLEILIQGAPSKQTENFPVKTVPGEKLGDPARPQAKLSDAEKQRILMEYINRVLGETRNR